MNTIQDLGGLKKAMSVYEDRLPVVVRVGGYYGKEYDITIDYQLCRESDQFGERFVINLNDKTPTREQKLEEVLRWALEWIDAVPQHTQLPGMPGFDRDYVNDLLAKRV